MVRTILIPDKAQIKLDIPKEYIGKEIEVTYIPLEELNDISKPLNKKKKMTDFWAVLSDDTASKLHRHVCESKEEWERDI